MYCNPKTNEHLRTADFIFSNWKLDAFLEAHYSRSLKKSHRHIFCNSAEVANSDQVKCPPLPPSWLLTFLRWMEEVWRLGEYLLNCLLISSSLLSSPFAQSLLFRHGCDFWFRSLPWCATTSVSLNWNKNCSKLQRLLSQADLTRPGTFFFLCRSSLSFVPSWERNSLPCAHFLEEETMAKFWLQAAVGLYLLQLCLAQISKCLMNEISDAGWLASHGSGNKIHPDCQVAPWISTMFHFTDMWLFVTFLSDDPEREPQHAVQMFSVSECVCVLAKKCRS